MFKTGAMEEIIVDMKNGVYDFTENGDCSSCGSCCSNYLPLSSKDVKRITRYIEKYNITEQKHFLPIVAEVFDMTCPFRSEKERKCLIYDARPTICKEFRCDKPKQGITFDKFQDKYNVYDVRQLFFGGK